MAKALFMAISNLKMFLSIRTMTGPSLQKYQISGTQVSAQSPNLSNCPGRDLGLTQTGTGENL
jgi:hypothetical protein